MGTSFDDVSFLSDSGMTVYYHKILPYSICKIGPLTILHEMVVFPDAEVCTDWDGSKDGLEEYNRKKGRDNPVFF